MYLNDIANQIHKIRYTSMTRKINHNKIEKDMT